MQQLPELLDSLLSAQGRQLEIGKELQGCLREEERAAAGFSLAEIQKISVQKAQHVQRFSEVEKIRQQRVSELCAAIGLDAREGPPSLSEILLALGEYSKSLVEVFGSAASASLIESISKYTSKTQEDLRHYETLTQAVKRNKIIVGRVLRNLNRSVRFFEQAFGVRDLSYNASGRQRKFSSDMGSMAQLDVKA